MNNCERTERMELMEKLAQGLREVADKKGMTKQELSSLTGIDIVFINKYFDGKVLPTFKNICNICFALDCKIGDLINTKNK